MMLRITAYVAGSQESELESVLGHAGSVWRGLTFLCTGKSKRCEGTSPVIGFYYMLNKLHHVQN